MSDKLKVCRVCLEPEIKVKLSPIFTDSSKNKIAQKIFVLSGIQIIDMKNKIPALICKGCVEDLSRAIYLRKLCIKSDLHFKNVISELESETVESTLNESLNTMKEEYLEEFIIKTEYEDGTYAEEYFIPNQHYDSTEISQLEQQYDDDVSNDLNTTTANKREPLLSIEPLYLKAKYQKGKLHKCKYCVKMFVSKFSATQHEKTMHEVLAPSDYYVCDLCGAQLKLKHYLRPHFNRKHLNLHNHVFPCTYCGKTLTSNYSRRQHEKMLHKQSPKESPDFECHLCGHTAKRKAYIYKHMMTVHIKKYDYICTICNKNFCTATSLKNHISCVHKKLKPHACPHCEKCFAVPDGLRNHIRSHTQEKPFTCEFCHEGFKYRKGYRDHKKRYHQDPLNEQCSVPSYNWSVI